MPISTTSSISLRGIRDANIWLSSDPGTTRDIGGIQQLTISAQIDKIFEEGNEHAFAIHTKLNHASGKIIHACLSFEALEWLLGPNVTADSPSLGYVTAKFRAGAAIPSFGLDGYADYMVKDGIVSSGPFCFKLHTAACTAYDLSLRDEEYFTLDASYEAVDDGTNGVFDLVAGE